MKIISRASLWEHNWMRYYEATHMYTHTHISPQKSNYLFPPNLVLFKTDTKKPSIYKMPYT